MPRYKSMKQKKKPSPSDRRRFLRSLVMVGGLVGASLVGVLPAVRGWVKKLRPPGALPEHDFLSSCIKCGQCVQVCPVEAIKLADMVDGVGVGTPWIDPRKQACDFSCDGLQCVLACPTGALTHHLNYPHEAKMAVAKVARPESCLARRGEGFQGYARGGEFEGMLRFEEIDRWNPIPLNEHPYDLEICDLCVRQCPIEIRIAQCDAGNPPAGNPEQCPPEPAIRLVENGQVAGRMTFTPEVLAGCVGCGVCEMVCPGEPSVFDMDLDQRGGHA
jgi:ferredoxin-type protein NapG